MINIPIFGGNTGNIAKGKMFRVNVSGNLTPLLGFVKPDSVLSIGSTKVRVNSISTGYQSASIVMTMEEGETTTLLIIPLLTAIFGDSVKVESVSLIMDNPFIEYGIIAVVVILFYFFIRYVSRKR